MKTPSERGVTGAWAYQARQEAGLSVEQVAEAIGARGTVVSPATIRGIESGAKKPGARLLRLLAAVLESVPPGGTPAETSDGDMAAAIRAQTDALTRLARAAERQAAATGMLVTLLSASLTPEARQSLDRAMAASLDQWADSVETPLPPLVPVER